MRPLMPTCCRCSGKQLKNTAACVGLLAHCLALRVFAGSRVERWTVLNALEINCVQSQIRILKFDLNVYVLTRWVNADGVDFSLKGTCGQARCQPSTHSAHSARCNN